MWSDDGEAAPIVADEGVRLRTVKPVAAPPLETLAQVQTINTSSISKPTLYVLTTGVRHFQAPQAFTTTTVMGQVQTATVGPTFDEGYGPQEWPEGAKRVVDGMVTIWMKIAAECSGWCFVSEDDAIWPNGIPSELPSDGFVSFFKEAVCAQATGAYSENYDSVVKAVIPGKCMPYGAVAYAITGNFAKMLLSNLPMSKPVDHFLWEQAVVQKKAYVSRRYVVRHKKGKSLRQNTVKHPPPNADNPVPMLHNNSGYILYKDVDQLGSDIGKPVADARGVCSRTPSCVGYNHMGWMKSSVGNVHKRKGMSLYVKRKHSLQMYPSEAFKQPTIDCNLEFNGPVDVVYTWVNWTHPAYIAQMRANGIFDGETKEPNMNYDRTATSDSYNELRYSMASLLQNDKKEQIRNIYVVINPIHGPPSWLNISHPRIKIIHHNILLPQTPTNNAWAIQTCLHRIPDLSPWFLALNDDVILNRPLKLSSKEISCPRGEITQTHCPTLRNTCLMGQLETHFQKEVDQVYNYRKKSTLEYRPEIILWLEHHNWLVANGHAVVAVTDWFGKMNTNGWRHDPKWVGETWQRVIEKEGRKTWLNFQGQGIWWEYPENPTIRSLFNAWIHNQHYPLHSAFFKKNPQTQHPTTSSSASTSVTPKYNHHPPPKIAVAIPTYNRAGTPLHTTLNRTTIDVVIPWVNYSSGYHENEKVPFDFGEPLFNIVSTVGLKRPPWSEICWTVRSILFYGSQYIRNVYIVYNSYRHAAPDCHFGDNVISMPQQVFLKGTILEGLSSPKPHAVFPFFHRIKSLSDYFLFSMDDIFLLKPFDLDTFYDSNSQQILTHMTGGIRGISAGSYESNMALERIFGRPGQFSDGLHVPFLVKKKSQEDMMHSLPFLFSKCSEPKYLCDFGIQYQTLIQNYMVLSGTARNSAATIGFSEIHTDEQTNLKQALHVSATWLNVQGTGVSDEYGGTKSARIRLRTVFDSWLIKQPFYHVSKPSPKIAVAIPTYNRAGYVQLCATALNKTIHPNDVWIFDDHSTEYTAGDLQKWFGSHSVQRNAKRFKADKQARHILEWFVGTDYDWLITLDSDLIVRPDWLELLRGMLPHTQGVMSLYHSGNPNHPTLHCDPNLCEMKSLGNAGVAWSKVLAKKMLVDMTQSDGFDWGWTEWLRKQKIPQYAAKDSLVLHVGMHGTWGADSKREKSVGFPMDKLSPDVRGRAELFLKGMQ